MANGRITPELQKAVEDSVKQRSIAQAMDDGIRDRAVKAGEQTFTLVEHDKTSPRVICFWIMENLETARPEKLVDALLDAIAMQRSAIRRHVE
jgi:hypothetical protein